MKLLWASIGMWWQLAVVGAILAALVGMGWRVHHNIWQGGYDARDAEAQSATLLAMKANDRIQLALQADATKLQGEKDARIRSINERLADALSSNRMLQRANERRDLSSDTGACAGGTGAGLAGPDAAFLERYAAGANRLRTALDICQRRYEAVRRAQPITDSPPPKGPSP